MRLPSLVIAFASSTLLAAAPPTPVAPATPVAPTSADAPPSLERQQLARRYISLAVTPNQFMAAMRGSAARTLVAMKMATGDESDDAEFDTTMDRFFALLEPKIRERMPNLMEAYAQAYAREFSADELTQLIVFIQSPAGQHYIGHRVELENDPAVQLQEQGIGAEMPPILREIEKEQCQARTAQRVAAGDKKAKCALSSEPETQAS
jgi:hypothetical protein